MANTWTRKYGGTRIKKIGNYWIKEVDPDASKLSQWWGRGLLEAQSKSLYKLGDMAPSHLYKNGKIFTRDAGKYVSGNFGETWLKGSWRLKTPFNDIRPRNIGADDLIFDPSVHPLQEALEWGALGLAGTTAGVKIYNEMNDED